MTVNISHHCDDPNVGMAAYEDLRQYKMFVGDTGLFVTLAFKDKDLYERLFQRRHVEISACLSRLFPVSQPQRLVWLQVEGLFPTQEQHLRRNLPKNAQISPETTLSLPQPFPRVPPIFLSQNNRSFLLSLSRKNYYFCSGFLKACKGILSFCISTRWFSFPSSRWSRSASGCPKRN